MALVFSYFSWSTYNSSVGRIVFVQYFVFNTVPGYTYNPENIIANVRVYSFLYYILICFMTLKS